MTGRMGGRALHLTEELVARVERLEPEYPGRQGLPWMEDAGYARHAARLLREAGRGPVWTFAYGSLIWKPAFAPAAAVPAVLHGWRRSFCIHLESWRGTPDQPGLMLALDRGAVAGGWPMPCPKRGGWRRWRRCCGARSAMRWISSRCAG
ncbi:MAG: gamma-glutamylcyclotransferase [Paracoccaceae bacterium]